MMLKVLQATGCYESMQFFIHPLALSQIYLIVLSYIPLTREFLHPKVLNSNRLEKAQEQIHG